MEQNDFAQMAAQLTALLDEKLGLRKGTLAQRAAGAGRRLPKSVRADLTRVAEAAAMSAHPRLAQRIDAAEIGRAHTRARVHLATIDPAERRKGALLGILGGIAFNLLLLAALMIVLLRWRGVV